MEKEVSFDKIWEEIHSTKGWGGYPPEYIIRFIARNYYRKERETTKILDFCCGAGACRWYLEREGFDTYAFDGSKSAVEKTKEKLKREHLNANVNIYDAIDVGYENNYFDVVLDNCSIFCNRMKYIKKMYQQAYRILLPKGKLLTVCIGRNTQDFGCGEEVEEVTYRNIQEGLLTGRGTIHFYLKEEIVDILAEIGFKEIRIDTISYTDEGRRMEQYIVICEK